MRFLPARTGHPQLRARWAVRAAVGIGMGGGLLGLAPTVSAVPPNATPAGEGATAVGQGSERPVDDPHVRAELIGILGDTLQSVGASGVIDDVAGPTNAIVSCLVDFAARSPSTDETPNMAGAVAPCFTVLNAVDPTALPRALASLKVGRLAATLTAAKVPHDPSTLHNPQRSTVLPPAAPPLPAIEPDPDTTETTPPDESTPDTSQSTPTTQQPGKTEPGSSGIVAPTTGTITSPFGDGRGHQGIDIANTIGTPIVSVAAGKVISAGPAQGFGLWVRIRHDDGTVTTYGHNNSNLVSVGERVTAGQTIATVGNRGQSTGPHLHFEVTSPKGKKVDPEKWLDDHGASITEADRNS